jgi:phage-related protein
MSTGGGGGQALADLFVQFSLQGQQALQQALTGIRQDVTKLHDGLNAFGQAATAGFTSAARLLSPLAPLISRLDVALLDAQGSLATLQRGFQGVADAARIGFGVVVGSVGGFVTAGLHASALGEVFSFQLEKLSRTIAGVFRPELQKVVDLVTQFANWLNNLSQAQKASIAHFLEGAAAALGMALILPRIVAGVQALVGAVSTLTAALSAGLAVTGIGPVIQALGLLLSLFAGLLAGTAAGRSALSGLWQALQPLAKAFGELWQAIQPVFESLSKAAAAFVQALAPVLAAVVRVAAAVAGALAPVFAALAGVLEPALKLLGGLLELLAPILEAVAGLASAVGQLGAALAEVFGGLLGGLLDLLRSLFEALRPVVDFLFTVVKYVLDAIGSAIKAVAGLIRGTIGFVKELFGIKTPPPEEKEHRTGRRDALERRLGGMESIAGIYDRLAAAAIGGTAGFSARGTPEEQAAEHLADIRRTSAKTADALSNARPLMARS